MNGSEHDGRGRPEHAGATRQLALIFAFALVPFLLLSTLNSAGYRYGASDQAFYAPVMLEAIDPSLYPRDSDLIRAQGRLTLADNVIGPLGRWTGVDLPLLFVGLQVLALGLLALAAISIAGVLYRTAWAAAALLAALTLRHAISKSGTNTLEGYFHPRQLSFAIGALALAAFLRGRYLVTIALVLLAGALHPTTGAWFAIWLGIAILVQEWQDRRVRRLAISALVATAVLAVWSFTIGPLAGRLVRMDSEWLATLSSKEYLFPLEWPAAAWLVNLGYVPIVGWIFVRRRRAGLLASREMALVIGCLSLAVIFLASLPFNAARVALAIQLQPARVFWMLDFLAVTYVVWVLAEGVRPTPRRAFIAAIGLAIASIVRGGYIMLVEFPERRVVQVDVNDDDWGRAMAWARGTDVGSGWLADPSHAVRYGTSVRVAGRRDVFVEGIKDAAVGMYDRDVAIRTRDRVQEVGDFTVLEPARARAFAARYELDYLITEQTLDLPEVFRSGAIRIYRLR